MSQKVVEKKAHAICETCGSKFKDIVVFNEVMSKHNKWDLTLFHDTISFFYGNEESNDPESVSSSKRSRTSENGEYDIPLNPEIPSTGCSNIDTRKREQKKKGKCRHHNMNLLILKLLHKFVLFETC